MIPKEIRECAAQLITSMRNRRVSEVRWKAHDALIALADVVEAAKCADRYLTDWFALGAVEPPQGLGDAIKTQRGALARLEALKC